jgi:hypothetical protein
MVPKQRLATRRVIPKLFFHLIVPKLRFGTNLFFLLHSPSVLERSWKDKTEL